jgi:hypothetical protein
MVRLKFGKAFTDDEDLDAGVLGCKNDSLCSYRPALAAA